MCTLDIEQKKKIIKNISNILMIFTFVAIVLIPSAFAGDGLPEAMFDTIKSGVITTVRDNLSNTEIFNTVTAGNTVSKVITAIKGLAGLLIIIIATTRLIENIDKGNEVVEAVLKTFVEIGVAGIFVINLDTFVGYLTELGQAIFNDISAALPPEAVADKLADSSLEDVVGEKSGLGIVWWLKAVTTLLLPYVACIVLEVMASFVSYSIILEIGIRKAFTPIAVVDIYGEGLRSPGARYLKKYLGALLKLSVTFAICMLGVEVTNKLFNDFTIGTSLSDIISGIFKIVAVNATVIGLMFKAGEYTNDIMGV